MATTNEAETPGKGSHRKAVPDDGQVYSPKKARQQMMDAYDKLELFKKLADVGIENHETREVMLGAIIELASRFAPKPPAKVSVPAPSSNSPHPTLSEVVAALKNNKIEAIKNYRARTSLGLKESKDAIEIGMENARLALASCTYTAPFYTRHVVEDMPF